MGYQRQSLASGSRDLWYSMGRHVWPLGHAGMQPPAPKTVTDADAMQEMSVPQAMHGNSPDIISLTPAAAGAVQHH